MTAAMQAHLRLLERTPRERIHTHIRSYRDRMQGQRLGKVPIALLQEVKALRDEGLPMTKIMRDLKMGEKLYKRIERLILDRGNT